jgi:hypothetical protein
MTSKFAVMAVVGATLWSPPASAEPNDACALLTSAEIAAALGTAMGAGQPITPTDHKVCTWKASEGQSWVTVMIQTNAAFDAGKKLGDPSNGVEVTPVGELGDDAYYLAMNDQVGLAMKKGDVAFKVAVFQHGPLGPKQSVERALAGKILTRL